MNNDRVKGRIDEVVGSAKRKAGDLIGDAQLQVEGMVQQVKGKAENALGMAKDIVKAASEDTAARHESHLKVELHCNVVTGIESGKKS